MENRKVYCGNGRSFGQYGGVNIDVNLNQVFAHLAETCKEDKAKLQAIGTAFKALQHATKDVAGFSQFKKRNGKDGLSIRLTISAQDGQDDYGNTHSVTINTFIPDKSKINDSKNFDNVPDLPEYEDDLPF
jgi:stage V sporulation protein SpoVS